MVSGCRKRLGKRIEKPTIEMIVGVADRSVCRGIRTPHPDPNFLKKLCIQRIE